MCDIFRLPPAITGMHLKPLCSKNNFPHYHGKHASFLLVAIDGPFFLINHELIFTFGAAQNLWVVQVAGGEVHHINSRTNL